METTLTTISVSQLANKVAAFMQCTEPYKSIAEDTINDICKALPHGSGLDGKVELQLESSTPEKLCFYFEFHHMDENGFYCGWTEHNLFITPSLQHGFNLRITGRDKNDVKEYLYQIFQEVFTA